MKRKNLFVRKEERLTKTPYIGTDSFSGKEIRIELQQKIDTKRSTTEEVDEFKSSITTNKVLNKLSVVKSQLLHDE